MRIAFAFMAEAGQISTNGTFAVVGGGMNTIKCEALPEIAKFCVVVKFNLTREEATQKHIAKVQVYDPNGTPMFQPAGVPIPEIALPEASVDAEFTCLGDCSFLVVVDGMYSVRIFLDDIELAAMPLLIQTGSE